MRERYLIHAKRILLPILFFAGGFAFTEAQTVYQRTVFGTIQVMATLNNLSGILWVVLIGVAIIFFTIGGYRYLTWQGNAEEVKTANKMLIYGLVALAVGLVARGLIYLVNDILAP